MTVEAGLPRARGTAHTADMAAAADEPLRTTSLADEIAFRLQSAIVTRSIAPGARLRQEELCARFGVSRTPVREALRKLQALRLVVMVPNRGTVVRLPTRDEVAEVYDVRAELESYAAELACARADRETDRLLVAAIAEVRRHRRAAARGNDVLGDLHLSSAVRGFHHVIQDTAGNARLTHMIRELESSFPGNACTHEAHDVPEGDVVQIDEHEAIRAAIRAGDPAAARNLMRDHILHSKRLLLAHLDGLGLWGKR